MKHLRQHITLVCLALLFSFAIAQLPDVQMTPEEAQVAALESHYEWDAWHNTPKVIRDSIFYGVAERMHKARAKGKYTTGEPLLRRTLRPDNSFFESDEIREMCLQSKHFVAMQEYSDYSQARYEANGVTYSGPEAYVEQGINHCLDSLKGRDEYVVPILDLDGQIVTTSFVDVLSGLGGGGGIDVISATEAQQLVGSSTIPQYFTVNIPTNFPPYNNDWVDIDTNEPNENWVEGGFNFWLVDDYAVDPTGNIVFQTVNLQGESVSLLNGEVEPLVMLKNITGMYGEDVMPKLIYPVRLKPIENVYN